MTFLFMPTGADQLGKHYKIISYSSFLEVSLSNFFAAVKLCFPTKPQTTSMSSTGLWGITLFSLFVCACALVCAVFSRCSIHEFCYFLCQCFFKLKRILIMSHLRLFLDTKLLMCLLIRNSENAVQFPWVSTPLSPNLLIKKENKCRRHSNCDGRSQLSQNIKNKC